VKFILPLLFAFPMSAAAEVADIQVWGMIHEQSSVSLAPSSGPGVAQVCFENRISSLPNYPRVDYSFTLEDKNLGLTVDVDILFEQELLPDYANITVSPNFYVLISEFFIEDNATTCIDIFEYMLG
jgi:hypothetical protein